MKNTESVAGMLPEGLGLGLAGQVHGLALVQVTKVRIP